MKLLLIEDDKRISTAVKRGLEGDGFTVDVAYDGIDGLWMATEGSYDVLIVDLMLPGKNGFRICGELREQQDWTPILVLTAKDGDLDEAEALDTGADDYLTKPFSYPVLVARLRALLRRTTGQKPVPLNVGDLRIDPGERRVWRASTEVELTTRQFDLLEFLIRRSGQVMSKSEILAGVWDHDFEGDPNIVEVYVGRLRSRVDQPFDRHTIETVRGAGYRVVPDANVKDGHGPMNRLLSGSIRVKVTALSSLLAGLILLAAAVALVILQRQQLTSNLDNSLEQLADTYEATLAAGDSVGLSLTTDQDRAIQLVDDRGQVLIATPNITGHPPLQPNVSPGTGQSITEQDLPLLEDDAYRILSRAIDTDTGSASLHIAENIDDLNDAIQGLTIALAIAVPTVVALLAGLTWWLVGRTLRPVEQIRAEVSDISGTELSRRVPVSDEHDEIARLAVTMNEMLDRLEVAARQQRQFVADASHELRTPLTRIRAEIEVDLNRPANADLAATHRAVLAEAIELQQLLDDLLFLARSDENHSLRSRRPVDLDDVVLREVANMRGQTSLSIDTSGVSPAHLIGDDLQLTRAVRNLLGNAIRHATSVAIVETTEDSETVRLVVSDDGPGVPEAEQERIFGRFARADDARGRLDGGSGLGLAIVQDIVQRHGGTVSCTEASVGGAQFTIVLPLHPAAR